MSSVSFPDDGFPRYPSPSAPTDPLRLPCRSSPSSGSGGTQPGQSGRYIKEAPEHEISICVFTPAPEALHSIRGWDGAGTEQGQGQAAEGAPGTGHCLREKPYPKEQVGHPAPAPGGQPVSRTLGRLIKEVYINDRHGKATNAETLNTALCFWSHCPLLPAPSSQQGLSTKDSAPSLPPPSSHIPGPFPLFSYTF